MTIRKRAYHEAWYRHTHDGQPSPKWKTSRSEEDVEVWEDAMNLASEENISPWDALLSSVRRRSARIAWADAVTQHIIDEHKIKCDDRSPRYDMEYAASHDPEVPPDEARKWLTESRNEERLMTRSAKMAIDAGVAQWQIQRVRNEGKIMMDSLLAALDILNLTPEQRTQALNKMHDSIAAGMDTELQPATAHPMIENKS